MTSPYKKWKSLIVTIHTISIAVLCINCIDILPQTPEIAFPTMALLRRHQSSTNITQHTSLLIPPLLTSSSHHTLHLTRTPPVSHEHDTSPHLLTASHPRDPPQDHVDLTIKLFHTTRSIAKRLQKAIISPHFSHRSSRSKQTTKTYRNSALSETMPTSRSQTPAAKTRSSTQTKGKTPAPLPVPQVLPEPLPPAPNSPVPDETPVPMDDLSASFPTPMDTSDPPPQLQLSQEDSSNINDILNGINNPRLLQDAEGQDIVPEGSPSNSPAKKKSKPSSPEKQESVIPSSNSHKKRTKKRSSSTNPASVLKPSKYSTSPGPSEDKLPPTPPHIHKNRKVLIEISVDFGKESLSQFDGDNGKKMVFAIQQLILNLKIAEKTAIINPTDADSEDPPLGGLSTSPVPTNMTALSNYIKGLNPRSFQSNKTSQDAQAMDTSTPRRSALAYGVISISCDKDPELLVNQISYEWARFGTQMKIKELQAVETITPVAIYYVYALTHRQTLIDEQRDIFKEAQKKMHEADYFLDHDLPMNWGYKPLPLCSLRTNVPRIPKHSEPVNMARLPSNIQTCRRVLHLEIDKADLELVTHLVNFSKSQGLYKRWWGSHAHPTEGVDWQSPPGDIKRAAKFAVKTTNYNASMTSIDVYGFLDLNDLIEVKKPDGSIIKSLTGREVLTSFFKFEDNSPLIAEVHQQVPLGSASLVYPNIPEGEKLIIGLAKQVAAFTSGHLGDQKVDQQFIKDFLKIFVDPQLIHEATQCEWDSKTQTLLTPTELADDSAAGGLEDQGWWKDVVLQYESQKGQGKRAYAAPQALFDLDGAQSVKTMHEANDNASGDQSQESSKRVRISKETKSSDKTMTDNSVSSVVSDEGRGRQRSGHTPPSVGVRVDQDSEESERSVEERSSTSTASDADPTEDLSGTSG